MLCFEDIRSVSDNVRTAADPITSCLFFSLQKAAPSLFMLQITPETRILGKVALLRYLYQAFTQKEEIYNEMPLGSFSPPLLPDIKEFRGFEVFIFDFLLLPVVSNMQAAFAAFPLRGHISTTPGGKAVKRESRAKPSAEGEKSLFPTLAVVVLVLALIIGGFFLVRLLVLQ
jgi:hypothetical protein